MLNIKPSNTLEKKLETFSEKQRKIIFQNTLAIQLTEGCSGGCIDCGAGALVGVRDYILPSTLENLMERDGKKFKNLFALYFASDPFDYNFEGFSYPDIHRMVSIKTNKIPFVSTSAPKGSEQEILKAIVQNNTFDITKKWTQYQFIRVLSLMKSNYNRLSRTFSQMEGFKEEDQIKTKDFHVDKGDSVIITDPVLKREMECVDKYYFVENQSDILYLIKSEREYIGVIGAPVTFKEIILSKELKRKRAEAFGRFMSYTDVDIFDFYSMDLPKDQLHQYRLGEHFKDNLSYRGIQCFHGIVLTPIGIYNYQAVEVSPEEPLGWKKTEITPENFEVIPYKNLEGRRYNSPSFLREGTRRIYGKNWFEDALNKNETITAIKSFFN